MRAGTDRERSRFRQRATSNAMTAIEVCARGSRSSKATFGGMLRVAAAENCDDLISQLWKLRETRRRVQVTPAWNDR